MKIKTHEWFVATLRDKSTTVVHVGPITNIDQDNMFCKIDFGGTSLHVLESDQEIMKLILGGYEFDVEPN